MKDKPKFVTKLYANIDSYIETKNQNKQNALDLSRTGNEIMKPIIEQYNGVWMYGREGKIYSNFAKPEDAVNCAVTIQRTLQSKSDLNVRIGIHTGDIKSGIGTGDIVASGIAELAAPGGVCISEKTYAAIQNQMDVKAEFLEEMKLEGVERSIRVYALIGEGLAEPVTIDSNDSQTYKKSTKPSIAVLPFVDMSPDKDQEYFCDGMTEEIINALSHIEDLKVIARTSAFAFKGKQKDIREIGSKLDVENLLEGSVRKAGNRLRITAQLVKVVDGSHLWSDAYNRELEDVFAIQEEISLAIVDVLKVKLLKKEKTTVIKRYTENIEAYKLYLQGRYHWNKRTEKEFLKAIKYFQQAIEIDQNYVQAYVGIADSYNLLGYYGLLSPDDAFPKAKKAMENALLIDDNLAEAITSLAWINIMYDWNWPSAESSFKRVIATKPNYSQAHYWYGYCLKLMGQFNKSLEELHKALELEPLSLITYCIISELYDLIGRYDESTRILNRAVEIEPIFGLTSLFIGIHHCRLNRFHEGLAAFHKAHEIAPGPLTKGYIGFTYGKIGEDNKAKQILTTLLAQREEKYFPSFFIAFINLGLGENDKALEWLENACKEHDPLLLNINATPEWDPIRSDPRFKTLLKKMGLSE